MVAVAIGVGVGLGRAVAVAIGVGEGLGRGVGVGLRLGRGAGVDVAVRSGDAIGSGSIDGVSVCWITTGVGVGVAATGEEATVAAAVTVGAAVDSGSTQLLVFSPFAKFALTCVLPCRRITGPSNFPWTILPV